MTHYEQLKRAKTRNDFFQALFEYEIDLREEGCALDIFEWLDREVCQKKTMLTAIEQVVKYLSEGLENE